MHCIINIEYIHKHLAMTYIYMIYIIYILLYNFTHYYALGEYTPAKVILQLDKKMLFFFLHFIYYFLDNVI